MAQTPPQRKLHRREFGKRTGDRENRILGGLFQQMIDADDNTLIKPLSPSGHLLPFTRDSLIEIKPDWKGVSTSPRDQ
jgi:hypothetical protein